MGRVAMQSERAEVVKQLRMLVCKMTHVADHMTLLGGDEVDAHAIELRRAAAIADGWADGVEKESGDAGG